MLSVTEITIQLSPGILSAWMFPQQLTEWSGGDQHSQPFPRRGERLESHPGCFYYQTVNVSLSVLNTEGTLLLPLVQNVDITWLAVARIG